MYPSHLENKLHRVKFIHIKIEQIHIGLLKLNKSLSGLSHVSVVYGSLLLLFILAFVNYRKGEISFMEIKALLKKHFRKTWNETLITN